MEEEGKIYWEFWGTVQKITKKKRRGKLWKSARFSGWSSNKGNLSQGRMQHSLQREGLSRAGSQPLNLPFAATFWLYLS